MDELDQTLAHIAASPLLKAADVHRLAVSEPAPIDLEDALVKALAHPVGSARLSEVARGKGTAVIITADATRAVPNRAALPVIIEELHHSGISDERITVVIGTGAHRAMTPLELIAHLGEEWVRRLKVVNHDPRAADLVSVGRTPHGNEVRVNRLVAEAGVRIALGQVEPHEFAGYTGGRKAILPAVAGYDTIIRNHSVDMISHPGARPGELLRNPIHLEMLAAAQLAGLDFIVNFVVDRELRPVAVAAGNLQDAHQQLVGFVESYSRIDAPSEPVDLIVTGPGRPLDYNLYQSIKPLVALEPLVDERTVVLLLSSCRDGNGSAEMLEPFAGSSSPRGALAQVSRQYTIEKDHSLFLARFLVRCPQVIGYCPGVRDADMRTLMLEPAATIEDGLAKALKKLHPRSSRAQVMLFPRPQRALISHPQSVNDARPTEAPPNPPA
jgi:nickel-dependent lactate racemase